MADTEVTPIGVKNHGSLVGLADDDHSQYLNTARHDVVARHGAAVLGGDLLPAVAVGDILVLSADIERASATWDVYEKIKEFLIGRTGAYRIKFEIKAATGASAKGRIYRNGVAVGTEQSVSNSYILKSEDIAGWNSDDTCELWVLRIGEEGVVNVRNFRLYYNKTIEGSVIID